VTDCSVTTGGASPHLVAIEPETVPEPYRQLLVHERDMTSTLESFWRSPLRLRVLDKREEGTALLRQVVLVTIDGKPVEFGAIRIQLDAFALEVRADIVACERPLGGLLEQHAIPYTCRPRTFFRLEHDPMAQEAFGLLEPATLFGRHNTLTNGTGATLAEVVEVLPPIGSDGEDG
jgi:hypothetical protein